jgi:hypothetical protein
LSRGGINITEGTNMSVEQSKINKRGLTSFFTLFGFIIMSITGLALYVVPQGRVAYWVNWEMLGMTRTQWSNIHILSSILFIAAGAFHIYFNWKPLMHYFKNRITSTIRLRRELLIASGVSAAVIVSSLYPIPPLSYLLDLNAFIKDAWVVEEDYEPPFGHAELLSLSVFSKKMDIDLAQAEAELKANGILYSSADETLETIAAQNGISPMNLYLLIKKFEPVVAPGQAKAYTPESVDLEFSGTGIGNRTIAGISEKTGVSLEMIEARMVRNGLTFEPDQTLKNIATAKNLNPLDVLKVILVENHTL